MRLSEIRTIILKDIDYLNLSHEAQTSNGECMINNITQTIDAIERLSELTFLLPTINNLRSMGNIYNTRQPRFKVSSAETTAFKAKLQELRTQCEMIIGLANTVVPKIEGDIINIKLFENADTIDVQKLVTNLQEAFSQISNLTNYKGSIKFSGFEAGTDWINFIISGANYIPFVYLLIQAAYEVARDFINLKLLQQRYTGAVIQNQVNEGLKDVVRCMSSEIIKKMKDTENLSLVQDEVDRLIHSTTKIANTIIDGNKIEALLTVPPEQQGKLKELSSQIDKQNQELKLLTSPEIVTEQSLSDDNLVPE